MSAGGLLVAIHSSDPDLGDPEEFVFYLTPPYTPEHIEAKRREMEKRWVATLDKQGKELRSEIRMTGPFGFFDDDRALLDDHHMGDDEFLLTAWFRMRTPLLVGSAVIDMWADLRRDAGAPVYDPVPAHQLTSHGVLRNRNDIFWKAGAS